METIDNDYALSYEIGTTVIKNNKKYITTIEDGKVIWKYLYMDLGVNDLDFLIIGDENKCAPCRRAMDVLATIYRNMDVTHIHGHQKLKWKKWKVDIKRGEMEDDREEWLREQEEKDEKLREWKTYPKIWRNGEFIGGEQCLYKVLKDKYEW